MIDADLLEIICCPETHQRLSVLGSSELNTLNASIAKGILKERSGKDVRDAIDGGLIREDGQWVYPVRGGIPVLLIDSAIPVGRS